MTLIELMVAIAIMLLFFGIMLPSMSGVLLLKQRQAARDLALIYARLHDEAILRNRTFRIAFHLDEGFYEVEMGHPEALIHANPDDREAFQERLEEMKEDLTEEEWAKLQEKYAFVPVETAEGARVQLPEGLRFVSVYTPQYEEPLRPHTPEERARLKERPDEDDPPRVAYSHVFASGFAEYTLVQVVNDEDERDGYTVIVDPLSGKVELEPELVDKREAFKDIPREGPALGDG
jgi:hypothetical protein